MASLVPRSAGSEKRAAVEAAVLEATEALLAEGRAFADLRVEEIATRAGLSRTAFYFYFRGKRELLVRLVEGVAERLYAQAEEWWTTEGDGRAALTLALERALDAWAVHGPLMRAAVEVSAYDGAVAQFWRAVAARFMGATRRRIAADGLPVPAEGTAFVLCWMTERACYQWLVEGGDMRDPVLRDGLVAVWTRALYGDAD